MPRPILITTLLALAVGVPLFLGNREPNAEPGQANSAPVFPDYRNDPGNGNFENPNSPFRTAGSAISIPAPPNAFPVSSWNGQSSIPSNPANLGNGGNSRLQAIQASYGAGTVILPGDASGPDFSAPPMEFLPFSNLGEIFRFSVTPQWVQGRWQRISTSPVETGLHGLRVALVTGTNSWDLHGSLTYYFDPYQKCQRVSFRGWSGDPGQLIQLLEQTYGFKSQPTSGAGLYLAGSSKRPTSGMIMKQPPVVYTDNRVERFAIILEINNAQSKQGLSGEFQSLLRGISMSQ